MDTPLSFGYNDGWFNGNPNEQIRMGTYGKYRSALKGFTAAQMEVFDARWEEVLPTISKKLRTESVEISETPKKQKRKVSKSK